MHTSLDTSGSEGCGQFLHRNTGSSLSRLVEVVDRAGDPHWNSIALPDHLVAAFLSYFALFSQLGSFHFRGSLLTIRHVCMVGGPA